MQYELWKYHAIWIMNLKHKIQIYNINYEIVWNTMKSET